MTRRGRPVTFTLALVASLARPHCPVGGEAQGIRALEQVLARRYGSG